MTLWLLSLKHNVLRFIHIVACNSSFLLHDHLIVTSKAASIELYTIQYSPLVPRGLWEVALMCTLLRVNGKSLLYESHISHINTSL